MSGAAAGLAMPSATMRNRYSVAREAVIPFAHAPRDRLVTLSARRHKVPLVVFARGNALRIAVAQLRDREPFPFSEGDLGQAPVFAVSFRRQAERGAHQRHGFAGAAKRARHVIEIRRMSPDLREPIAQKISAVVGLRAAARVERDVVTTLQAAGDVPIGFTVTNVVDRRRRHRR
jgi:hypothetical protein